MSDPQPTPPTAAGPVADPVADPVAGKASLLAVLGPLLAQLSGHDPKGGAEVAAALNRSHPVEDAAMQDIFAKATAGVAAGWLTPREADGVRFGRLAKASAETSGFSIDVVVMDGPGPGHTHPEGELDLCFSLEGAPTFDGRAPGWVVYGPGSWHVPTVRGGRMLILYFLPGGSIRFGPPEA